jgi:hypothetical protein
LFTAATLTLAASAWLRITDPMLLRLHTDDSTAGLQVAELESDGGTADTADDTADAHSAAPNDESRSVAPLVIPERLWELALPTTALLLLLGAAAAGLFREARQYYDRAARYARAADAAERIHVALNLCLVEPEDPKVAEALRALGLALLAPPSATDAAGETTGNDPVELPAQLPTLVKSLAETAEALKPLAESAKGTAR